MSVVVKVQVLSGGTEEQIIRMKVTAVEMNDQIDIEMITEMIILNEEEKEVGIQVGMKLPAQAGIEKRVGKGGLNEAMTGVMIVIEDAVGIEQGNVVETGVMDVTSIK